MISPHIFVCQERVLGALVEPPSRQAARNDQSKAQDTEVTEFLGPNRVLYGTTLSGGGRDCEQHSGCGTVFAIKK
jgi:hypothetical protein